MHPLTALIATSLAGVATALPAPGTSPSPSSSKGFHLRARVRDASRDLTPPISGRYLSDIRTGAGTALTVLSASAPEGSPFYVNGTSGGAGTGTTTVTHDIPGVYPLSLGVAARDVDDPFYPGEHPIGASVSSGSALAISPSPDDGVPVLSALLGNGDGDGSYAVCSRSVILGGVRSEVLTARYVYGDETVPDDCAPVDFVAECAVLPDLPGGSSWDHESALEVPCVAK